MPRIWMQKPVIVDGAPTWPEGRTFHAFDTIEGENAYALCGTIFSMRRSAAIRMDEPDRVCGICRGHRDYAKEV